MRTLTSKQATIVAIAAWLVVLLIFLLDRFIVGQENQLWVTAIYVVVITVATSLTVKIPPYKLVENGADQNSKQPGS